MDDEISNEALDLVAGECICRRARMVARTVTRVFDDALRPCGLRITQFTLLVAIGKGAPDSISLLAEWLAMERTTLVRNLQLLEKEGLIERGPEGGRRAKATRLTQAGRQRLAEAFPYWEQAQKTMHQRLGDEWQLTQSTLDKLVRSG
ncbi:MarR family winged helix-turn-helix transcriptional regulator [Franzmannia qiaohouensis]|uniref:MarR family winged helix-turn-helix transcriptional regulator n=1 Tax=Franzmannia qiaohouensis TaxID=1329370 RepID=A0ABU1HDV0_9GAMM|nr:MarR family winged helix-turn-helix transcriptional regulator [Halomonas qiaohouensis]MDR5905647.1 MarR family winged helix-turn-helix transcriptional regulator [Halomonas qiaohouensis]